MSHTAEQHVLGNGLRTIISSAQTIPTVAVCLMVGAGSSHDLPGRHGLAHMAEHVRMAGTSAALGPGGYLQLMHGNGVMVNAGTGNDATMWFQVAEPGSVELGLWALADRLGASLAQVDQNTLHIQRAIIGQEKFQVFDSQPYGSTQARLLAQLFPAGHPYHHHSIGSAADLAAITLQDVVDFLTARYVPANMTLAIVGDITAGKALELADRYLGALPAAKPPHAVVHERLRALDSPRRVEVPEEADCSRVVAGFRLPVNSLDAHAEILAAALAMHALAEGPTSRLYNTLVRSAQLATGVTQRVAPHMGGASIGWITVDVVPGLSPDPVCDMLAEQLDRVAAQGFTDAEVARAKALTEAETLSTESSHLDRAQQLANVGQSFGQAGSDALDELLADMAGHQVDRFNAVAPERVHRAADDWLASEHAAVIAFHTSSDTSDIEE
ncbi:pitrilysin family protein [Acrocarpospora sp. B8E8]|uniref:M16 family metallopeptidase n=1 Tax=Acrocarpospora sp. B8E8 TaxID=3153572 RepID=UPI00325CAB43